MISSAASVSHAGESQYQISGVLDFDSVPALMHEIKKCLGGRSSASISFAEVEQCNSAGLALLLDIASLMQGKAIEFTEIPRQMSVVAQAYGVSEELKIQGLIKS